VSFVIGQIVRVRDLGENKFKVMDRIDGRSNEPWYKLRHTLALFSDTPKDIVEVERPQSHLTAVASKSVPPPSPRKPRKT
jgi:hypothetical protein